MKLADTGYTAEEIKEILDNYQKKLYNELEV